MDELDYAHFAGVIDATHAITVYVSKNSSYKTGYKFEPMVRYQSTSEGDPLLGKLMAMCEDLGVKYNLTERNNGEQFEIRIDDPEHILRFLEPILPHLTKQFEPGVVMVEEIIPRIEDDKHLTEDGLVELMEYAEVVRTDQKSSQKKYDAGYFKEEFGVSL